MATVADGAYLISLDDRAFLAGLDDRHVGVVPADGSGQPTRWDRPRSDARWEISRTEEGTYTLKQAGTGSYLRWSGDTPTALTPVLLSARCCEWTIIACGDDGHVHIALAGAPPDGAATGGRRLTLAARETAPSLPLIVVALRPGSDHRPWTLRPL